MQFDKYKKMAEELGLEYLSNIEWVEGEYTLETYADGDKPTAICAGNTWEVSLKTAEKVLRSEPAKKDRPREPRGIGEGIKNFEDYEIRVLRIREDDLIDGEKLNTIELSVGKKEV